MSKIFFLIWIIFFINSCGQDRMYEDYEYVVLSDLRLTEENHPHGWGYKDCFYCHVKANIHYQNPEYSELGFCHTCHDPDNQLAGFNGVESW